ncbi:MAG: hypothetical protein COA78_23925 [Blastopirellula sp.]|nr:MAG: hypothetical protein COA78_23925 [Blastopirellula sp.]
MKRLTSNKIHRLFLIAILAFASNVAYAQTWKSQVNRLIESSCISCHDESTETGLNFEELDFDLSNPDTFRQWEKIFDRTHQGEMPPKDETRPEAELLNQALASLKTKLRETNLASQKTNGRVPSRRLTRLEYEYTLHDLLHIRGDLAKHLPPENTTSAFDTVGSNQGISPVHIQSYLQAADVALDEAIQLGPSPKPAPTLIDYQNSKYVNMWTERPLLSGGSTSKMLDDAFVTYETRQHVAQSNHIGFHFRTPGLYRITAEAYGYQAKTPVIFCIYRSSNLQGNAELISAVDLPVGKSRTISITRYFTPGDYFYPSPADHDSQADGRNIYSALGSKFYKGEGLAVKWLKIEGPLETQWPPKSTRQILKDATFKRRPGYRPAQQFDVELTQSPHEHIKKTIEHLGPQLFRRPLAKGEVESFLNLATPSINNQQPLEQNIRAPLRAMLSSPQFLFHSAEPGQLVDYALATRLSYFLWKTTPDAELLRLAKEKKLNDPAVLRQQVNRLLDDPKSDRFVHDFLDQWLGLQDIDATTPDKNLYPEYDDILRQAMLQETRLFFRALIDNNLGASNLIDSEFTFLNRKLAEHYKIPNIVGEHFRRVDLPKTSVRGGLLTQASILKVTANGTVTSPVKRGSFVLSKLLGTPPSSPPPNVGSVDPDTRGATTIRETLDKHRNVASCASCHQHIDPPGFALESFDPIGGYRTNYRSTEKGRRPTKQLLGRNIHEYRIGLPVDASGVTVDGQQFAGIRKFKNILLSQTDQVAKNLVSQLMVYSTGGDIQFADRDEIERIVQETKDQDYPVRTMIHQIVQSPLFRNK